MGEVTERKAVSLQDVEQLLSVWYLAGLNSRTLTLGFCSTTSL